MKTFWKMPEGLVVAFHSELTSYHACLQNNDRLLAWRHLERAHILGQSWAVEHTRVHWLMLKFGFRIKSMHEILGQIPRLLFGGVKSFVGKIPVGNAGGANVRPLMPMEIPDDLKELLKRYKSEMQ